MTPDSDGLPEYYQHEGFMPGSLMYRVRQLDPDDGDAEPTEAGHEAFGEYVVATYDQEAWDAYRGRRGLAG